MEGKTDMTHSMTLQTNLRIEKRVQTNLQIEQHCKPKIAKRESSSVLSAYFYSYSNDFGIIQLACDQLH